MIRRMIWPLVFGIGGVAILVSLGVWQVQRLAWKEGVLAEIEARIAASRPSRCPKARPEATATCPSRWRAHSAGDNVRVLVSQRGQGRGTA
jgi:surfeit locus 1 family protein